MNKILNNEQKAADLLFEHLKEMGFESREYDVMIHKDHFILLGKATLCYDPTQPTLTEIDVDYMSLLDRHEDSEVTLDYETFCEVIKSMIYEYSIR